MNNIICAISTAQGIGGIAIIRLSGDDVINVVNKYFKSHKLDQFSANTINYGHMVFDNNVVDEVMISVFKGPNSFTGEDVVEINCHGGIYITNLILKNLLRDADITLAKPGEFSQRAFLNGKKSLNQVLSANEIINATNKFSHDIALSQLDDHTQKLIEELRLELLEVVAQIEVNIDYPEYEDIEIYTNKHLKDTITKLIYECGKILEDSQKGSIIKKGIDTAIIGSPNVGKSTLLNTLSRNEKAIVTDIAGTTRDVIESQINVGNVTLNLIDTAGIRDTTDIVEQIGVEKSKKVAQESQIILFIVDGSRELTNEEISLYESVKHLNHIVVINKSDLETKKTINQYFDEYIKISAIDKLNIETIENKILEKLDLLEFNPYEANILLKLDDISKIENCLELLKNIESELSNDVSIDILEIDLKEVLFIFGEILNIEAKSNLIDELFSKFCLGK